MLRWFPYRLTLVTVTLSLPAFAQTPASAPATENPAAAPAGAASPAADAPKATPPVKTAPSPYSPAVQKGDGSYLARDFDSAIAAYRQDIEKNPNAAVGHYRLGEAQLAKGSLDEAEQSWQTALRFVGVDESMKSKVLFALADLKERAKAYDETAARWKAYEQHARAQATAKGHPETAVERVKRIEAWKKLSAEAAEVKARIEKRAQEADERMRKSSK